MTSSSENIFCKFKKKFLRFWKTENTTIALARDVLIAFLLVLILLTALWAYTGQWFGAPMVAIESGSMSHPHEAGFGNLGFIDAGDMVLLVKIENRDDIVTRGSRNFGAYSQKNPAHFRYGDYGDVIVFYPYGDKNRDQIIHRAMCWVDVHEGSDGTLTYSVKEYGETNQDSINIDELGLKDYKPSHEGFITKGDNNLIADQSNNAICSEPIKVEWVSGKARGLIPWIGTLNLFFNDITSGRNTVSNVPGDSITCLVILIAFLISIPITLDLLDFFKRKNNKAIEEQKKQILNEEKSYFDDEQKNPPYY